MKTFPKGINFKYSWRNYQQRVLDELSKHLYNDHLHVIAPPGSGKTVLGLEVALRLNNPVLVLAPTIAIRNQWIQRFCELFLQTPTVPDWISTDVRNPGFMTVSTYQGLHAACSGGAFEPVTPEDEDEENEGKFSEQKHSNQKLEAIAKAFKKKGVATFVLDEAHHLKNSWWATLTALKKKLEPVVVALTATPPYDVTYTEWQRYTELNGPVDAEISLPELVAEGDLCPHQDYIYYTVPTRDEEKEINVSRKKIKAAWQNLLHDETILAALQQHPAWLNPEAELDWIYNNTECYSAMLIYLNHNKVKVSKDHLDIIGNKDRTLPNPDAEWMEALLNFYLFADKTNFTAFEEHRITLENSLRHQGATERRRVSLVNNTRTDRRLALSLNKLSAINEITEFEYDKLGSNLRMVILTDYIRKEYYTDNKINDLQLDKIGVLPIFEQSRRNNARAIKLGVLTGALAIIPTSASDMLIAEAAKKGIMGVNLNPLPYDEDYCIIQPSEKLRNEIVNLVTAVFEAGGIEVLTGTKSLLGEGWDAPSINSLIIASFVGSFVLSNQMRGRAIRMQRGNEQKTGNIWHLVCIDREYRDGGEDLRMIRRRFKGFSGVSYEPGGGIENGVNRLLMPEKVFDDNSLQLKNQDTFERAGKREELREEWKNAIASGVRITEEIRIPPKVERKGSGWQHQKTFYYNRTIKYLLAELVTGISIYLEWIFNSLTRGRGYRSWEQFRLVLYALFIGGLIFFGKKAIKSLRLYIMYRDIAKDVKQITEALLEALCEARCIETPYDALSAITSVDKNGFIYCHLDGGTTFEKSLFINSLTEIVSPINNPRYVIVRKSNLFILNQRDYHAVPEAISRTKKPAADFAKRWKNHVGECELIFTRTQEGRKLLLKSRAMSLSSQIGNKVEQVSKWR